MEYQEDGYLSDGRDYIQDPSEGHDHCLLFSSMLCSSQYTCLGFFLTLSTSEQTLDEPCKYDSRFCHRDWMRCIAHQHRKHDHESVSS